MINPKDHGLNCTLAIYFFLCAGIAQTQGAGSQLGGGAATNQKRPMTVADAIEMTTPGGDYLNNWDKPVNVGLFSPDRSRFAFITKKGDLKKEVVSYSIWVFETRTVMMDPRATLVATLTSSSNRPAISHLRWLADNETLVFLGERPGEMPQIYESRISNKQTKKLTDTKTRIVKFSITDSGNAFVYATEKPVQPVFTDEVRRHGFFVPPGHRWEDLYLNKREFDTGHTLFIKTKEMETPQIAGGTVDFDAWNDNPGQLAISPNGKYALLEVYNTAPPISWDDYSFKSDGEVTFQRSACLTGTIALCPKQYSIVDLEKRLVRPLINAPTELKFEGNELAGWTAESTILLVNALLPLDSAGKEETDRRKRSIYAAEVSVPDGNISVIEERKEVRPVDSIKTDLANNRLIVKPPLAVYGRPQEFRKAGGKWTISDLTESTAEPDLPISVDLDEDINTPPKLVATDPTSKKKVVLLDLNPQFAQFAFGKVEILHWKNRDGQPIEGELYYPSQYASGTRYPLVIQTHGETATRFWVTGPFSTTNAAQPLSNNGFFVLQMGWTDPNDKSSIDALLKVLSTPREAPYVQSFVESAIDMLDQKGLIDRNRVGLSGFSRTVFHGEYFLTHSMYPIGAAVMADGVEFGYGDCLYLLAESAGERTCEQVNGGVPWGESLANWAKESGPMRLDKIHTPLLLQSISAPLGEWEVYAGLQWLKKPVELVNFYPEGEHILVKPQQVFLSEQSAVDWYCFWLKSEEDPDPAKAEQYARWRELRKLQPTNAQSRMR